VEQANRLLTPIPVLYRSVKNQMIPVTTSGICYRHRTVKSGVPGQLFISIRTNKPLMTSGPSNGMNCCHFPPCITSTWREGQQRCLAISTYNVKLCIICDICLKPGCRYQLFFYINSNLVFYIFLELIRVIFQFVYQVLHLSIASYKKAYRDGASSVVK